MLSSEFMQTLLHRRNKSLNATALYGSNINYLIVITMPAKKKVISHFAFHKDASASEIAAGLAFLSKKRTRAKRNG